jgi:hypothetical protein
MLGGITVLFTVPLLVALAFSPEFHEWVRSLLSQHTPEQKTVAAIEKTKRFLLPEAILKIAEVSRVEPDSISADLTPASKSSRALLRLQRTLQAHAGTKTEDILRAANESRPGANRLACPVELIRGEQSLTLGKGPNGEVSFAETLDRCAEAIEHLAVTQRYANH